jgi:hypothetical protein
VFCYSTEATRLVNVIGYKCFRARYCIINTIAT